MDFGGRGRALESIHAMIVDLGMQVTILAVGSEAKVYTPEELIAFQAEFKRLNKVQSNASGQREVAMAQLGEEKYFEDAFREWKNFRKRGGFNGMQLKWGDGMTGDAGVEGAWKELCEGTVSGGSETLVFRW